MVAIFVLSSFILILLVDHLVLKFQGRFHPAFEPRTAIINISESQEINYQFPSNFLLSDGHTWLKKDEKGLIEIGVDILAARALGGLSIIKCSEENSIVKKGDVLFMGKYGSEIVEILSPISGKVEQINNKIIGNKILDPYKTWGIKLHSNENIEKGSKLLSDKEAINWLKEEFQRFEIFLQKYKTPLKLVGETMFDGGAEFGMISMMPVKNIVNNFKKEFLSLSYRNSDE